MDTINSDQLVSLCEPRMPLCLARQIPWEALQRRTTTFGEVVTRKVFVQTQPTSYARPSEENKYR